MKKTGDDGTGETARGELPVSDASVAEVHGDAKTPGF
jgi:hypothetical protein